MEFLEFLEFLFWYVVLGMVVLAFAAVCLLLVRLGVIMLKAMFKEMGELREREG